jgi:predicted  nucleic acid-binding Zn-ribbon protein
MSISFTKTIVNQLQKEIADIESKSLNEKKKIDKAQIKLKQIQKDIKLSQSASDLSSKMSRINKLNEEIKDSDRLQKELAKTLVTKKATLKQNLAKEIKKDGV